MMEELTHPVELADEQLDLVAAGGGNRECGCEGGNTQVGLINVNDVNVGVNILGFQNQTA